MRSPTSSSLVACAVTHQKSTTIAKHTLGLKKNCAACCLCCDTLSQARNERASFQPPETVGPYQILREIGRGGMGVVFEATNTNTQKRVALKVLLPENNQLTEHTAIARFGREAVAVSRIEHPHVVPLLEVGHHNDLHFIAMQLVEGSSLDRMVRLLACANRSNPDDWFGPVMRHVADGNDSFQIRNYFAWVMDVGVRIAEALHHAHQVNILHRDVKPSNVLVDRNGQAWLTDFGSAKTEDARLTQTGQIIGTLRYLAPERLHGHCDELADVYGLGLVLYELLTLGEAFPEQDRLELIKAIEQSNPTVPHKIVPNVPRDLENVIMRSIAKHRNDRPQSADEFARALRKCDASPKLTKSTSPWSALYRWTRKSP